MIERSERLRFALEPCQAVRISAKSIGQDFERDVAIELGIVRTIDLAHAAGTEQGRDRVDANLPAHGESSAARLLHPGGPLHRRRFQESLGGRSARQQRLDFHPQGVIARARLAQEDLALFFAAASAA